ncbi:hypothetical protein [Haladaptatus sp. DYF46]|uniref:hypothetical protein n=1 Tax=Haladaptatus sp. DYF46 TaxID=2886041 RepID=UPI001E46C9A0|nr:hypothetical protein [Haladaptatus sp. DYF46]
MSNKRSHTRRTFLAGASSVVGATLASTTVAAQDGTTTDTAQNRTTRQMVARQSKLFENNYAGQFVIVADVKRKQANPDVISTCEFPNWNANETWVYNGVFIDNLGKESTSQQSVRTDLYMNGNKEQIEIGQPFIINNTKTCSGNYVGLEAQSIPTYAANGQPMGATVAGTDEENPGSGGSSDTNDSSENTAGQPGFGVLAGLAGITGVGLKRMFEED